MPNPVAPGTALDAVNEALGLVGTEVHVEPETELTLEENDDGTGDDGEGAGEGDDPADAGTSDDPEGEGEIELETPEQKVAREATEAAAIAAGKGERNADGTFKAKAAAKAPDPVNDPIPKDLKTETRERMQSLITTAKTLTTERDQVQSEFNTIIQGVAATGATPEQYGETLSWLTLFNSPEPASRMKAYELVNDVADRLAMLLNVDRTVRDPLANHADLKAAVAAGQTTAKFAAEIARTRDSQAFTGQIQNNQREQQTATETAAQEEAKARKDLSDFEAEMKTSDPLYQRKRDLIVPSLQATFQDIPKSKWADAFKRAYKNVRIKPQGKAASPGTGNQPMRANRNPAGGQAKQPTSMLDAVTGALNGMGK